MLRVIIIHFGIMAVFLLVSMLTGCSKKRDAGAWLKAALVIAGTLGLQLLAYFGFGLLEKWLLYVKFDWVGAVMAMGIVASIGILLGGNILLSKVTDSGKPGYWLAVVTIVVSVVSAVFEYYEFDQLNLFMDRWDIMNWNEYLSGMQYFNRMDLIQIGINVIPTILYDVFVIVEGVWRKKKEKHS